MEKFRKLFRLIIVFFFIVCCFFTNAKITYSDSNINENSNKKEIKRSLESLRDFNSQTWQIIVYPSSKDSKELILRIVGYPGSLRLDYPADLIVTSGRKKWDLEVITKLSKVQVETLNDSTAEFNLSPLIADLDKNRPLRLRLPGVISDLPIPPYLVSEWRTLAKNND
tara:strand:+ start:2133 stop:2636 length:504 start_codon:yes stop_codon:yes gene_type:complete